MNKNILVLVLTILLAFHPPIVQALTVAEDSQYIIMNFSTIIELDWGAPEEVWQAEVKPQILSELDALLETLPRGSKSRKLAWSTLMEYMNHPADVSNDNSIYVIKTRRIFEIAEERDLPIFIPLNGFQWWDEQPELYNWWDPDGTKTPAAFFNRQDQPETFRRRFIAGYNPDNRYNVEWSDWETPMQLNWRNWGGGGFRLAPPPNLLHHSHTQKSYRTVLEDRYKAILQQVVKSVDELEKKGKSELFVGVSIGTEISLNASATPHDEFMPYGYRAMQDYYCRNSDNLEDCLSQLPEIPKDELQLLRQRIVSEYLLDLSIIAARLGIPKQKLYTHVWGESYTEDPKYAPYAPAAFNLYARPGISLYGFAQAPHMSLSWSQALQDNGLQPWGGVEYSLPKESVAADEALVNTLEAVQENFLPAKMIVLYNWGEHKNTPAIPVLAKFLELQPEKPQCHLPEIIPTSTFITHAPSEFTWTVLDPSVLPPVHQARLKVYRGITISNQTESIWEKEVDVLREVEKIPELGAGIYSWTIHLTGCSEAHASWAQPRVFTLPLIVEDTTPAWVKLWLRWLGDV